MSLWTLTLSCMLVSSPLSIAWKTQKQYYLRVALEHMFFNFHFFNRIVALWNDLPGAITITDEYCYLCLVRKLMNFILINLIPIKTDFYGLVTVFSIRDFITLSNKLINKLYDNYTKRFNEFKSRFRIFLYIVFFILLFILGKLFL